MGFGLFGTINLEHFYPFTLFFKTHGEAVEFFFKKGYICRALKTNRNNVRASLNLVLGFCAAVRGTTMITTAVLPIGTIMNPQTATTIMGFGLFGTYRL
jgi:hypothetical protein